MHACQVIYMPMQVTPGVAAEAAESAAVQSILPGGGLAMGIVNTSSSNEITATGVIDDEVLPQVCIPCVS